MFQFNMFQFQEFIDLILKDTKAGKDGLLTMNEYFQIVEKRPLYREMFGQVSSLVYYP